MRKDELRNLPKNWEIRKINEIGDLFSGNSINAKIKEEKYLNISNGVPYIATKDVGFDRSIDYENGVRIPEPVLNNFRVATKNTILICAEGGSAGRKIGITNQDVCFVNKLFALSVNTDIQPHYVFYYYQSERFQTEFKSNLTGLIGGVSKSKFKKIPIPIPPLPEQKQIVEILDQAFEAIDQAKANIEKNIVNANELFQSKLNAIFSQTGDGWEEKTFKEVCVLQRGFDLPKRLRKEGSHPLVSSSGIIDTHIEAKVKAPGVVTGRSGSIGNLFYIKDDFWPLNTTLYIKDFKGNLEEYVYYFIMQFDLKRFSSGAGVPTLNRNFVHDEKAYTTENLENQKQIVRQLNKLTITSQELNLKYNQKLTSLEELKKSILEKAFSGELTN